jgi:hypothetical protein
MRAPGLVRSTPPTGADGTRLVVRVAQFAQGQKVLPYPHPCRAHESPHNCYGPALAAAFYPSCGRLLCLLFPFSAVGGALVLGILSLVRQQSRTNRRQLGKSRHQQTRGWHAWAPGPHAFPLPQGPTLLLTSLNSQCTCSKTVITPEFLQHTPVPLTDCSGSLSNRLVGPARRLVLRVSKLGVPASGEERTALPVTAFMLLGPGC